MELTQLSNFLAVARHQSFTRAAAELGVSQSTLSRQVQRLEQEMAVPLLSRQAGAVALTPAGKAMQDYAEAVLSLTAGLRGRLTGGASPVTGDLRIAASTTPGEFLVPDLLAQFVSANPNVHPKVFITDSAQVIEELREGRWDLGFVGDKAHRDMLYDVVAEDEIVLAAPRAHPLSQRGEVDLADLRGQPFVEREEGSATRQVVRKVLARHKLPLPDHRVVMVLSTSEAVLAAVERGHGLAWLSHRFLRRARGGSISALRIRGVSLRRPLYMVRPRGTVLPVPARTFADWVLRDRG